MEGKCPVCGNDAQFCVVKENYPSSDPSYYYTYVVCDKNCRHFVAPINLENEIERDCCSNKYNLKNLATFLFRNRREFNLPVRPFQTHSGEKPVLADAPPRIELYFIPYYDDDNDFNMIKVKQSSTQMIKPQDVDDWCSKNPNKKI